MTGETIMFPLRFGKLKQAVGFLLSLEPSRRMNYTKLIKMLYIADRESIKETGEPITGDATWALPNGPILSRLTDLVRGKSRNKDWSRLFKTESMELVMLSNPGCGDLCDYEIEKLQELSNRYLNRTFGQMISLTHAFPEYKKNEVTSGRKRIALRDILEAVGLADQAALIEDDAKSAALQVGAVKR